MKQSEVRKLQEELALENNKNPKDQARITELNNSVGLENEKLTDLMMKNRGWEKQPGGKYHGENGNNGFDHVFIKIDADGVKTVLIVDSKQINDGSFRLGSSNAGMQLSRRWIEETVLDRLPDGDVTKAVVQDAIDTGKPLKTAVGGLDKSTGEYKLIMIDFNS